VAAEREERLAAVHVAMVGAARLKSTRSHVRRLLAMRPESTSPSSAR